MPHSHILTDSSSDDEASTRDSLSVYCGKNKERRCDIDCNRCVSSQKLHVLHIFFSLLIIIISIDNELISVTLKRTSACVDRWMEFIPCYYVLCQH